MKKVLSVAALLIAISGCTSDNTPSPQPVKIQSLGGDTQITEVRPADAMPSYPARGQAIARNFAEQPPLIPHKDDYAITLNKNGCMTCHSVDKAKRMKATPIAKSHLLDAKGTLNNHNYFCTQCHVAQADNKTELVGNSYSAEAAKQAN